MTYSWGHTGVRHGSAWTTTAADGTYSIDSNSSFTQGIYITRDGFLPLDVVVPSQGTPPYTVNIVLRRIVTMEIGPMQLRVGEATRPSARFVTDDNRVVRREIGEDTALILSDNPGVAAVDDIDRIIGRSPGRATITVTIHGVRATGVVEVVG
jgi:hypothetical protein